MSLIKYARNKLLDVAIKENTGGSRTVMLVDDLSMSVISSFCSINDIVERGVTTVLPLSKKRQPLRMDAIYVIQPCEASLKLVAADFPDDKNCKYLNVCLYTLTSVDASFVSSFKKHVTSQLSKRLKFFGELNLYYYIIESNIFLTNLNNNNSAEAAAQSLYSLCALYKSRPILLAQNNSQVCSKIGDTLLEQLKGSKDANSFEYGNDILLILDRSYDMITPLIHELTLEAMTHDLIQLQYGNTFKYKNLSNLSKEVILNSENKLWQELRFQHIADVLKYIPGKLKEVVAEKNLNLPKKTETLKDLRSVIDKLPQYRAEMEKFQAMTLLAEKCYNEFEQRELEKLCAVEQTLATNLDKEGSPVVDPVNVMFPILDGKYSVIDKLRVILIYILASENMPNSPNKNGLSLENLDRILDYGKLKKEDAIIKNFHKANVRLLESDPEPTSKPIVRMQSFVPGGYSLSRYVPILKFLLTEMLSGSEGSFPRKDLTVLNDGMDHKGKLSALLNEKSGDSFKINAADNAVTSSAAGNADGAGFSFGKKYKNVAAGGAPNLAVSNSNVGGNAEASHKQTSSEGMPKRNRIFIYVHGGLCYSEVRAAYEVLNPGMTATSENHNRKWEIVFGGSEMIEPEKFLSKYQ